MVEPGFTFIQPFSYHTPLRLSIAHHCLKYSPSPRDVAVMGTTATSSPGADHLPTQFDECSIDDFSPASLYTSLALDPSQKEIRLLEIQPGHGGELIRCRLFCVRLSAVPEYVALSYTWEPDLPLVAVEINSVRMPVRQNLCEAFLRMRSSAAAIRVWADAICIDQSSIPERNSQVPFMKDIYLSASQVYIWLGEGTEATDLASMQRHKCFLPLFGDIGQCRTKMSVFHCEVRNYVLTSPSTRLAITDSYFEVEALKTIAAGSSTWTGPQPLVSDLESLLPDRLAAPPTGPQGTRGSDHIGLLKAGLADISSRRWFGRAWVIQEMALPISVPRLFCGRSSICFDCFNISQFHLKHYISEHGRKVGVTDYMGMKEFALLGSKVYHLFMIRTFVGGPFGAIQRDDLAHAMGYSRYAEATNPRDKVYGLLGFAEPGALAAIRVDYAKPVLDVYADATRYFLGARRLSTFAWSGLAPIRPGWPSWVVDFEWHAPSMVEPVVRELLDPGTAYSAWPGRISPRFFSGSVLRLQGAVIGNVIHATPAIHITESSENDRTDCQLPDEALKLFLQVGMPCEACLAADDPSQWSECSHLLYFPEHATRAIPLRDAVWRLMIGDWIDALGGYRRRDPGPTPRKYQDVFPASLQEMQSNWQLLKKLGFDAPGEVLDGNSEKGRDTDLVINRIAWFLHSKRVFQSEAGWIGAGFGDIQFGDYIVAVAGGDVPLILRPTHDGFALVGLCYVEGLMFGELLKMPRFRWGNDLDRSVRVRDFDIQ